MESVIVSSVGHAAKVH